MIPFQPDRYPFQPDRYPFQPPGDWYERYWWDEGRGRAHEPLLRPLIQAAAERILRMVRRARRRAGADANAGPPPSRAGECETNATSS